MQEAPLTSPTAGENVPKAFKKRSACEGILTAQNTSKMRGEKTGQRTWEGQFIPAKGGMHHSSKSVVGDTAI